MPKPTLRISGNAPGDWYVDATCINCGTCRRLAPHTFEARDGTSVVGHQPRTPDAMQRAGMALLACPVGAIGAPSRTDLRACRDALPERIDEEVFDVGYASSRAGGAASWLLRHPDGNVLVDVPRFARPLLTKLTELGGVRWIVITHRGAAGEHAAWARHFSATRVMHAADVDASATDMERVTTTEVTLARDLHVVPVPGPTPGSLAVLWEGRVAGAGRLLAGTPDGGLAPSSVHHASEQHWRSAEALCRRGFRRLLPSHGHVWAGPDPLAALLRRREETPVGTVAT